MVIRVALTGFLALVGVALSSSFSLRYMFAADRISGADRVTCEHTGWAGARYVGAGGAMVYGLR